MRKHVSTKSRSRSLTLSSRYFIDFGYPFRHQNINKCSINSSAIKFHASLASFLFTSAYFGLFINCFTVNEFLHLNSGGLRHIDCSNNTLKSLSILNSRCLPRPGSLRGRNPKWVSRSSILRQNTTGRECRLTLTAINFGKF